MWPSYWDLKPIASKLQAIGGLQLVKISKNIVQVEGLDGKLASGHPFVIDYKAPLWGRDTMSQWGSNLLSLKPPRIFRGGHCGAPYSKLTWLDDTPVWVNQWPLSKEKLKALKELIEEQFAKGHIEKTTSPWNSPVFVIKKPGKDKWRLLHDLWEISKVIEDMGSLQPGMNSPTMLPRNWQLVVLDIKDCFFQIPLHPEDAPWFEYSVPTINREAPMKCYPWKVLPQGMKCSPSICQGYVASLLSPVHAERREAIILHYTDDVLMCAPNDTILQHTLDLVVKVLTSAGFHLQEDKVQRVPPWKYLGLEITARTVVPQKLEIKSDPKTLADLHSLCGSLNWVRPWLSITNKDLDPLKNLLRGERELISPRELTPEAKTPIKKAQKSFN
ncbi:hypothetical protein DUI87_00658 [Hirundo rustica rustica]|uniref:ribonuclease H n=1 Tax=Hirundo rustica rustica TaxID=333673 RepID=A0A3M0LBD1_HIRRU|nr:hypothetical protein DUI87_00658 [Hirundo rustica rustica]